MLVSEELARHLCAHPRPNCSGESSVGQLLRRLSRGNSLRHLDPERADLAGVDLERRAQPGRCLDVCVGQVSGAKLLQPLCGEGMHAGAEQCLHLLRGDRIRGAQAVNAGQARSDPGSRSLSAFGVVGGQPDMALLRGIQRRDLPGQVVVPRPGAELVDAHRHNH